MHRPIQDGLEDYLGGLAGADKLRPFHQHLAACDECRAEVEALAGQSQLLQTLRPPAQVDPAPGFYARVIERIEAQRGYYSFWSVFLEPVMARRIVYASLCLLVLLGSAVVTTGPISAPAADTPMAIMSDETLPAADGSDIHHDRTVVLTTLTSFRPAGGADLLQTSSD